MTQSSDEPEVVTPVGTTPDKTEPMPKSPWASKSYWAVIINEGAGSITCEEFKTSEQLAVRLRQLFGKHGYRAFAFHGDRLGISKPPHRYLMNGPQQIPLFEIDPVIEEDDSGSLDDTGAVEQDPVYRAITRQGLADLKPRPVSPSGGE